MRSILLVCLLGGAGLLGSASQLTAADDPVVRFQQAFSDTDPTTKRQALRDLLAAPLPDEVVLPLLVAGTNDRSAHDDAVAALRQRTGLQPSPYLGQSHYPNYPPSDHPLSWLYWLEDW